MARVVMLGKASFTATQLTLLAFIALKSWTCQLVAHVENLFKIETLLNVFSV